MRSRRVLFTLMAVMAISATALGQEINAGFNLSFPSGTTLFGFSGRYEASINSDFQWMVTPGIQFGGGATLFFIQGGVKHTLQQTPVYFAAEVGPIIGTFNGGSDTRFGFTPSVGYKVNEQWDLSFLIYTGVGTFVGFRAAYIFSRK